MNATAFKINVLDKLLEEIIKEENICNPTIIKSKNSIKGDGYTGHIVEVEIKSNDKSNNQKHLYLIAKKAKSSDAFRAQMPISILYEREIYMYSTIFPAYYAMEREKGLPASLLTPKFYKAATLSKGEVVILANMKREDYHLHEPTLPMDKDHVSLVMTEYGRLHALSYAFRDQHPRIFKKVEGLMTDHFTKMLKQENYINCIVRHCEKIKKAINLGKQEIGTYETLTRNAASYFDEILKGLDEYPTILHGDCWTNNIFFKYEDTGSKTKPTKVCFIDFQGSRLGSPVLDLSYFFYTCSSKRIIDDHIYYLELYYKSFSTYLQMLGSDPEKLYPYKIFENHWKKFAKYGLLVAILAIYAMFTEKDEAVNFFENVESGQSLDKASDFDVKNLDEYCKRVNDIVLHFVKHKYI